MAGKGAPVGTAAPYSAQWKPKHARLPTPAMRTSLILTRWHSRSALQVPKGKIGRHLFMCASSVMDCNHFGVGKSPFLHLFKPCHLWPVRPCAACVSLSFLHELNRCIRWSLAFSSWTSGFFLCIGSLGSCCIGQVGLLGFSEDLLSQQTYKKQQCHGPLGSLCWVCWHHQGTSWMMKQALLSAKVVRWKCHSARALLVWLLPVWDPERRHELPSASPVYIALIPPHSWPISFLA